MNNGAADQPEQALERRIAAYLEKHPDFFERHLEVLEQLRIPHPCRPAVSLLERQLARLREQNAGLRVRLQELLQAARANDGLAERMHNLHLALIDARCLDDLMLAVLGVLRDDFNAEFAVLRLATRQQALDDAARLAPGALEALRPLLRGTRPWCGRISPQRSRWLFDEAAAEVGSAALVPLSATGDWQGVLAIGSRDVERFAAGLGTVYLARIGELVSQALNFYLYPSDSAAS